MGMYVIRAWHKLLLFQLLLDNSQHLPINKALCDEDNIVVLKVDQLVHIFF